MTNTTLALSPKPCPLPGFVALSDQVYIRKADLIEGDDKTLNTADPRTVIIFAWGDANPKHVTKYVEGFLKLFPGSKIIVVISPILKAMTQTFEQRIQSMRPIALELASSDPAHAHSVLIHVMSNTGGMNYAVTLEAYRREFNKPLPHTLVALDSTPGTVHYNFANTKRLSYATALGIAKFFPWPFVVTQTLTAVILLMIRGIEILLRRQNIPAFSVKAVNSEQHVSKSSSRVYLYSKEDKIIWWEDLEAHAADATRKGYAVDCVLFEGSGHVAHMKMSPDKYWGTILRAWREANGVQN
ncbi:hypothetical protein F5884DRAFT_59102 [Xylogone sp. PMI_703]|nr:hypothetical protein F5884DRAFT_59102 [Xylogone sp. PMI_703]